MGPSTHTTGRPSRAPTPQGLPGQHCHRGSPTLFACGGSVFTIQGAHQPPTTEGDPARGPLSCCSGIGRSHGWGGPAWPPQPTMVPPGPRLASREGANRAKLGAPVLGVPSPASLHNSWVILFQHSKGALLAPTVALSGFKEGDGPRWSLGCDTQDPGCCQGRFRASTRVSRVSSGVSGLYWDTGSSTGVSGPYWGLRNQLQDF